MKKIMVSILLGLFMAGLSGQAWAGSVVAADLNCTNLAGCVQTNEISDEAVTNSKIAAGAVTDGKIADGAVSENKISSNAVSTSKIADGAVTDAKITGPISASKIEKPAKLAVVAKSGGDFTSIQAAIDFVGRDGIVKVMPGTYTETVTIGAFPMELQGSGFGVTIIQSPSSSEPVIKIPTVFGETSITGFTITGGSIGIIAPAYGDYDGNAGTLSIIANKIINNGYGIRGYTTYCMPGLRVKDNIIANNSSGGIYAFQQAVMIEGNTITGNGIGIEAYALNGYILHNTVTGNSCDIITGIGYFSNQYYTYYNVSFNIADCISGNIGAYNVKSNGAPIP